MEIIWREKDMTLGYATRRQIEKLGFIHTGERINGREVYRMNEEIIYHDNDGFFGRHRI
jgi:hypothetical protein